MDINIIVATGLYTFDEIPHFFHYRGPGAILDGPELMTAALKTGLIAQRILKEEGVDLTKVVIGHCGDTTDLDCLREIADAGSLLGMDRFGIDVFLPFEDRITTVAALAKADYADRMCWRTTRPATATSTAKAIRPPCGVDEAQITAMSVHNPARYFTGGQE